MRRRTFLRNVGGIGALTVVGSTPTSGRREAGDCATRRGRGRRGRCTRRPDASETPDESNEEPVEDVTFEGTRRGDTRNFVSFDGTTDLDGEWDQGGAMTFQDGGTTVHIDGPWWTAGPATRPVLDEVTIDPETRELTFTTTTHRRSTEEDLVYAQPIEQYSYEATVSVDSGPIEAVSVVHVDEELTTVRRDGEETTSTPEQGDGEETTSTPEQGDGEETTSTPEQGDGEETTSTPEQGDGEETTSTPVRSGRTRDWWWTAWL